MTIKEWMDELDLSMVMQVLIRGVLTARYPGMMDSDFGIVIDAETGLFTVLLNGQPAWVKTFEEVENLVNGIETKTGGSDDALAAGPGVGPGGLSG